MSDAVTPFVPDAAAIAGSVTALGYTVVSRAQDNEGNPVVTASLDSCLITFTTTGQVLSATMAVSGTVTASGYVAAIVAANNANTNPRGVKVAVDGDGENLGQALAGPDNPLVLFASRHLVIGDGLVKAQLDGFIDEVFAIGGQLVDFAARLATDPDHDDRDNAPENVFVTAARDTSAVTGSSFSPVTYERVAAWFSARGINDLPFDEQTGTVCLMMDGTPIDIVVADPQAVTVKIAAQLPATGIQEPGTILHACNHANLAFRSTVCAARAEGNWWIIARLVFDQSSGLSDSQVDQLIGTGVPEVAAQLKQTLKAIRES